MSWVVEYRDAQSSRDLNSRRTETVDGALDLAFSYLRAGDRVYRIRGSDGTQIGEAEILQLHRRQQSNLTSD